MNSKRNKEDLNSETYTVQYEYSIEGEKQSGEGVEVTVFDYTPVDPDTPDRQSTVYFVGNLNDPPADEQDDSQSKTTRQSPNAESHGRYTWTERELDEDTEWQYSRVGGHVDPSVGRFLEEEETESSSLTAYCQRGILQVRTTQTQKKTFVLKCHKEKHQLQASCLLCMCV